jgi:hypothetical protein
MASANLDLVRSICVVWERGDWGSADWAHPDIEYVIADGPAPGRWTGLAGLAEGARGILGAWEGLRYREGEYRELDDERVRRIAPIERGVSMSHDPLDVLVRHRVRSISRGSRALLDRAQGQRDREPTIAAASA